jgi:hypothetical protein
MKKVFSLLCLFIGLSACTLHSVDNVKQELAFMVEVDQRARKKLTNNTYEIDVLHTERLKEILSIHEWIRISTFGEKADSDAWLLVQHADHDPAFQESCLHVLEKLVPLGETSKRNYAYLYDRVALKSEGGKQKYGTQARIQGDQFELCPVEGSLRDVNERRREMGLETIEEYLKGLKQFYNK